MVKKRFVFSLFALLALAVLSGCADSSTVGTCIDRRYDINLTVTGNAGDVRVDIPVTVEADSVSETAQDTADEATATPETDISLPLPIL